ncbi:hypothetical protein BV22DRAFT_871129 [Leucogyrophana mollusca]|uniref:Uncharacterized protein n=1 Tax=Leucogyrophana mollusca TaxID=85980 RepID=A0ACB8B3D4_9AGAM|nr:hypothetical protein BV22DRAFT_871129 [Leucogyrophana mollusca]
MLFHITAVLLACVSPILASLISYELDLYEGHNYTGPGTEVIKDHVHLGWVFDKKTCGYCWNHMKMTTINSWAFGADGHVTLRFYREKNCEDIYAKTYSGSSMGLARVPKDMVHAKSHQVCKTLHYMGHNS